MVILMFNEISRRNLLAAAATTAFFAPYVKAAENLPITGPRGIRQGRLQQSVMSSVWGTLQLTMEERCEILSTLGFAGMDLPSENDFAMLEDYGLKPVMMTGTGTSFENGLIRKENHGSG